jgi:hypothetical protein
MPSGRPPRPRRRPGRSRPRRERDHRPRRAIRSSRRRRSHPVPRATSVASRDFPTPPAPLSVTRRTSRRRRRPSAREMSDSRPTRGVRAVGSAPALDGPLGAVASTTTESRTKAAALAQHRYRRIGSVRDELNPHVPDLHLWPSRAVHFLQPRRDDPGYLARRPGHGPGGRDAHTSGDLGAVRDRR